MSLLSHPEEEIVLSSPFEGVITLNNKPVSGAKVIRTLTWFETENTTDSTVTDTSGHFKLEAVKKNLKLSKLGEFVISQDMMVQYDGKEYSIWAKAKWDKGMYGELDGHPVGFRCELTNEFKLIEGGDGQLGTLCTWSELKDKSD